MNQLILEEIIWTGHVNGSAANIIVPRCLDADSDAGKFVMVQMGSTQYYPCVIRYGSLYCCLRLASSILNAASRHRFNIKADDLSVRVYFMTPNEVRLYDLINERCCWGQLGPSFSPCEGLISVRAMHEVKHDDDQTMAKCAPHFPGIDAPTVRSDEPVNAAISPVAKGYVTLDGIRIPVIYSGIRAYCPEKSIRNFIYHVYGLRYGMSLGDLYSAVPFAFMTAKDAQRFNSIDLGPNVTKPWLRDFREREGMVLYQDLAILVFKLDTVLKRTSQPHTQ